MVCSITVSASLLHWPTDLHHFTNFLDPVVTPEIFAQSVVDDYGLHQNYHGIITKHVQEQLSDFRAHTAGGDSDENPNTNVTPNDDTETVWHGQLDEEDAEWWEGWRKRLRTEYGFVRRARRATGKVRKRKRRSIQNEDGTDGDIELEGGASDAECNLGPGLKPMSLEEFEVVDEDDLPEDMRVLIRVSPFLSLVINAELDAVGYHCWIRQA